MDMKLDLSMEDDLDETTPDQMENSPRMRQHSNVHTQIQAFDKLLKHANSKFSRDKLHQNLKLLQSGLPYLKGNKIVSETGNQEKIGSIEELRSNILRLQQQKRKGIQKEEESSVTTYFETFFRDLQFLKNLKCYFDERIYSALYQYYYDPLDSNSDDGEEKNEDVDSGHSSQNGSDDENRIPKPTPRTRFNLESKMTNNETESEKEYSPERERLLQTVKELYELNQKWDRLFDETRIDQEAFDTDSSYEIHLYRDIDKFKDLFRLVPDIFTKGFKSVRLAKVWWMNANKLYKPEYESSNMATAKNKMTSLQNLLLKVKTDIVRSEQTIYVFQNDLQTMRERRNRVGNLNSESKKVQKRKDDSKKRYNEIIKRRNELKEKLSETIQGTTNYNLTAMQLRDIEIDLADHFEEMKLLESHVDLIRGERKTEKGKEEQFLKFCQSIEVKISKLRELITEKKLERRRCEKSITLLKINTERMTEIVNKTSKISPIPEEKTQEMKEEEVEITGPSFFLTQAPDDVPEIRIEAPPAASRGTNKHVSAALSNANGDKETHKAVQERLKQLYADFDFDTRYRPSSSASDVDDVTPEASDNEEGGTPRAPMGFKAPQRTRGKYVDHTYPLKEPEYHLKPSK